MTTHKRNVPEIPKQYSPSHYPVPPEGTARCRQENDYGFVVGLAYRFHSQEGSRKHPPYDVVTVEKGGFYEDHPTSSWVFINNGRDLFRKVFEVL